MSTIGKELGKNVNHETESIIGAFGLEQRDEELQKAYNEVKSLAFVAHVRDENPAEAVVTAILDRYSGDPKAACVLSMIVARGMPYELERKPLIDEIKEAVVGGPATCYSEALIAALKALPDSSSVEDHIRASVLVGQHSVDWVSAADDPLAELLRSLSE
jgi:hypothetical protein